MAVNYSLPPPTGHAASAAITVAESPSLRRAVEDSLTRHLIEVFLPSVGPTVLEVQAKNQAVQWLEGMSQSIASASRLVPFGSMQTGLALCNADVDLCFVAPIGSSAARRSAVSLVQQLGGILRRKLPPGSRVSLITRARVPIINIHIGHPRIPAGIQLDLSFGNLLALENTRMIRLYGQLDVRVRPLILFVKLWAKQRHICAARDGTLSSYTWTLLVLHYLINIASPPVLPDLQALATTNHPRGSSDFVEDISRIERVQKAQAHNISNVGSLLLGLFGYYASRFDYGRDTLWLGIVGGVLQQDLASEQLVVYDPLDSSVITTRSMTDDGFLMILEEISRALHILSNAEAAEVDSAIADVLVERRPSGRRDSDVT